MNPLDLLFLLGVYAAIAAGLIAAVLAGLFTVLVLLAKPGKSGWPAKWLKGSVIAIAICFIVAVLCVMARILIAAGAA